MTKKKVEENRVVLREPKAKKKLGLSVPKIVMPHEELFKGNVIPFDNSQGEHHVDDQTIPLLDDQNVKSLGDQTSHNVGDQTIPLLDDQNVKSLDDQSLQLLDDQIEPPLDDQIKNLGRPETKTLDHRTTKETNRSSKKERELGVQRSKEKNLDDQKIDWSKYEKTRATGRIGLRPNKEVLKKFKVFCAKKDWTLTEFFEISGSHYINLDDQNQIGLDDRTTFKNKELMMMWKTKPIIINLYYAYNQFFTSKVKWTAKDDQTGQKFNDYDPRVIELGILQTQANLYQEGNSHTTINGFLYYANEIKKFVVYEENSDMLDVILKINRENWQKITGKSVDLNFLEEGN